MSNQKPHTSPQVNNEVKAPGFGESLVSIFEVTGNNMDFSEHSKSKNKLRRFTDEKGVFQEMDDKKRDGKTTIAE
jgi:hypothetical protein